MPCRNLLSMRSESLSSHTNSHPRSSNRLVCPLLSICESPRVKAGARPPLRKKKDPHEPESIPGNRPASGIPQARYDRISRDDSIAVHCIHQIGDRVFPDLSTRSLPYLVMCGIYSDIRMSHKGLEMKLWNPKRIPGTTTGHILRRRIVRSAFSIAAVLSLRSAQ